MHRKRVDSSDHGKLQSYHSCTGENDDMGIKAQLSLLHFGLFSEQPNTQITQQGSNKEVQQTPNCKMVPIMR